MNLSGCIDSPIRGVTLQTVLTVSTKHMPDLSEDLGPWHWGEEGSLGLTWIYAYEEDPNCGDQIMPAWLLNICITARDKYNANWILLDPDGDVLEDLPIYDHP